MSVSESRVSQDPDSPLAFSMEGCQEIPPSALVPFYWSPGWNSVQAMFRYLDEPNGSMKGGDPGIRLIEPGKKHDDSYFHINHEPFKIKKGECLIVPVYQIYGSGEMSSASFTISQRIKEPFLYINQTDADVLNIYDGEEILLEARGNTLRIKAKIEVTIMQGIAGLSVNLPGMQYVDLPCPGKYKKQ